MVSPSGEVFLKDYATTFLGLSQPNVVKDNSAARWDSAE
jgi:hypothetical protein